MTAPTTRLAYTDVYDAFNKALEDPKGVRLKLGDQASARTFRARLNYARQIDRRDNQEIYKEGDPLYGRSAYDTLVVRIRQDVDEEWWVYIEHLTIQGMTIESLSEIGAETPPPGSGSE